MPNTFDVHSKRALPKIGGSEGGFIAIVVCLVLVIVASCTAVFFLLRTHPSDQNRAYRDRQRGRRHRHQAVPSSASYDYSNYNNYSTSPTAANPQSLQRKLAGMFRFGAKEQGSRAGGGGWVRTGSGDEWDSDSADEAGRGRGMKHLREQKTPGQNVIGSTNTVSSGPVDMPFIPPTSPSYPNMDTTSSVGLSLHPSYSDPFVVPHPPADPHTVRPIVHNVQPHPGSPTPTSSSSSPYASPPRHTASPEALSETNDHVDREGRKWSQESEMSVRTFTGGTKFIESL